MKTTEQIVKDTVEETVLSIILKAEWHFVPKRDNMIDIPAILSKLYSGIKLTAEEYSIVNACVWSMVALKNTTEAGCLASFKELVQTYGSELNHIS